MDFAFVNIIVVIFLIGMTKELGADVTDQLEGSLALRHYSYKINDLFITSFIILMRTLRLVSLIMYF